MLIDFEGDEGRVELAGEVAEYFVPLAIEASISIAAEGKKGGRMVILVSQAMIPYAVVRSCGCLLTRYGAALSQP